MNNAVAMFEKISFEQYAKDRGVEIEDAESFSRVREEWESIVLPERGSINSAGYDFRTPYGFQLRPGESTVIKSGIRCQIDSDWWLMLAPRSSMGIKRGMILLNTVGIIDSDYYDADNEGHIMMAIKNCSDKIMTIEEGERIVQGVFLRYGITNDDDSHNLRVGGIGSTGR